jgi:hypothetical protein
MTKCIAPGKPRQERRHWRVRVPIPARADRNMNRPGGSLARAVVRGKGPRASASLDQRTRATGRVQVTRSVLSLTK